jgi:glucose/mannose transport system substrate-binding protein
MGKEKYWAEQVEYAIVSFANHLHSRWRQTPGPKSCGWSDFASYRFKAENSRSMRQQRIIIFFLLSLWAQPQWAQKGDKSSEKSVEVMHWWTSGSEARGAAELKKMMEARQVVWKDTAVAGGGGANAITAVKARVFAKNPPSAAQIKGPGIQEWGREGVLAQLSSELTQDWGRVLLPEIANVLKHGNAYVAVPVGVHRVNWLWVNPTVFRRVGAELPLDWDMFFAAADKLKAAGLVAIAHGGQPWQDATLFESVVLGVGGADFYRKTLVALDAAALQSATMHKVFDVLTRIKTYLDKGAAGRDWNLTANMVISGKAGMLLTGDWAKGEFSAAGKIAGRDYDCLPVPGTAGAFTFNLDSLALFAQKNSAAQEAQAELAQTVMSEAFQESFSLHKGSIPARQGIAQEKFDSCAVRSMDDMAQASQSGKLLPSFAHNMAVPPATEGAMVDVIAQFMHSNMSSAEAVKKLARAARTQ